MDTRYIAGKDVDAVGFGCMNVSHAYGNPPAKEVAQALLRRAVDTGVRHFDTAALYGFGNNEKLVGETLAPYRKEIFLASKCGMTGVDGKRVIDGRPETLMKTIEFAAIFESFIDLYYLHRWTNPCPLRTVLVRLRAWLTRARLVPLGYRRYQANFAQRTCRHPIAAVQTEYSLWTRNPELGVLDACADLSAAFVAFSPVKRGS